jgi:hypothetical protein
LHEPECVVAKVLDLAAVGVDEQLPEEQRALQIRESLRLKDLVSGATAETMAVVVGAGVVNTLADCVAWHDTLSQNVVEPLVQMMHSGIWELAVMILTIYCCPRAVEGEVEGDPLEKAVSWFQWTHSCSVGYHSMGLERSHTVADAVQRMEAGAGGDEQVRAK